MPFVAPLLFGSAGGFDAIITFSGWDDPAGGAIDPKYDPNPITVVSDPNGYFGSVYTNVNYTYVPFNTFGDYEFTLIQNYSSANIDSSLIESVIIGGQPSRSQTIFSLTSGSTILTPSPVVKTITNNSADDGLTIRMAASSSQRELIGTVKIGIKKV